MEISDTLEVLQVIKLIFNRSMYRLDIAVIAPGSDGDSFVSAAKRLDGLFEAVTGSILSEAAYEL